MRKVYFNGKFVPETEAKLSIYDSALMFGDMVFEMTRSFNGKQFKLREHIDRLYSGIKVLRIPIDMSPKQMEDACYSTIEINRAFFAETDEHRLMIDVSRGLLGIYEEIEGLHKGPNVLIADFPLKWTVAGMGSLFDKGINCVIVPQRAIPAQFLDPKIKNRSRIFYLMANIEASQMAGENNWALLLDPDGFVAEGTGCNFFIVKDGVVISPEGRNILRGISRDYLMNDLCPSLNIPTAEKNIEVFDIYSADEAFVTGTPFCMLPVTSLNGLSIGNGEVGNMFSTLIKYWGNRCNLDIIAQIKQWDLERQDTLAANNLKPTPYNFRAVKSVGSAK